MPSSLLRAQSDSSDSDTSSSDEELLDESTISANSKSIADLYASAKPRPLSVNRIAGGLSARASEKIGQALLDGRRALLLRQWSKLLEAIKHVETALAQSASTRGRSLEWRLPIIARLVCDVSNAMQHALRNRRSLPADEAKALRALQQKLKKVTIEQPYLSEVVTTIQGSATSAAVAAILNSLECSILSGADARICLNDLDLHIVPAELQSLPELLRRHSAYAQSGQLLPTVRSLDLADNPIATLPHGLPDSLPDLEELDIRGTQVKLLPPDIVLFRSLATIHGQPKQSKSNTQELHREAAKTQSRSLNEPVPSLMEVALEGLSPEQYKHLPSHLAKLAQQSYACISCSSRCFPGTRRYLPASLVEQVHLCEPPIRGARDETNQSVRVSNHWIGGTDWRFCAACIIEHFAHEGCECLVCREWQRRLDAGEGIKWARLKHNPMSA